MIIYAISSIVNISFEIFEKLYCSNCCFPFYVGLLKSIPFFTKNLHSNIRNLDNDFTKAIDRRNFILKKAAATRGMR
jgi:hypothetical protein